VIPARIGGQDPVSGPLGGVRAALCPGPGCDRRPGAQGRPAAGPSARKPVRYEYDFGAGWVHEVTRTGSSRLAPGEAVPRCPSFSGDNPVEYWNEDEPVNPAPFNMAKVNATLADRV
jgi:hypothetical protein